MYLGVRTNLQFYPEIVCSPMSGGDIPVSDNMEKSEKLLQNENIHTC